MATNILQQKIQSMIEPILETMGFELFELQVGREVIRVFIDKEDGVTIKDCVNVNRHLENIIEADVEFQGRFALEVSSPGAERPLRSISDYIKQQGKLAKVKLYDEIKSCRYIIGTIGTVSESEVEIILKNGTIEICNFKDILQANLRVSY